MRRSERALKWIALSLSCLGLVLSASASALDVGARDVIAPPAGIAGVSIAVRHRNIEGSAKINQTRINARIDRKNIDLRYGRAGVLAGLPTYGYVNVPWVDYDIGGEAAGLGLSTGHGLGDVAIAGAIWPYSDRQKGRHWAVAAYGILPTGEYDSAHTAGVNLNPGNNRFAGILQSGVYQRLSQRLGWMGVADVMVFEDNDEFIGDDLAGRQPGRLEVKPYITYQTALNYQVNPALNVAASYYVDRGAKTRQRGGDWTSAVNRDRYGFNARLALSPTWQVGLTYKSTADDVAGLEIKQFVRLRLLRFW